MQGATDSQQKGRHFIYIYGDTKMNFPKNYLFDNQIEPYYLFLKDKALHYARAKGGYAGARLVAQYFESHTSHRSATKVCSEFCKNYNSRELEDNSNNEIKEKLAGQLATNVLIKEIQQQERLQQYLKKEIQR